MPEVVLLLGPIAFQDFEIPSAINFGGGQHLEVHRLPGGKRVIDAMGRDDARISFSGIFSGSNATLRARSVDALRSAGMPIEFTWDVFFYTVLISDFHADYRNSWWIPFRITCTVLQDEASALIQSVVSLATTATADIVMAASQAMGGGVDLAQLQAVFSTPDATVRGTATYTAAQSSLAAALGSIGAAIGSATTDLAGVDFVNLDSANDGITNLLNATDAARQLSSLTTASAYVQRVAINLANAST
jgi:hypothetical protein